MMWKTLKGIIRDESDGNIEDIDFESLDDTTQYNIAERSHLFYVQTY